MSKESRMIRTKVVGVTNLNYDGTSRQQLIQDRMTGEPLRLIREYNNDYDESAVKVLTLSGEQLGYLRKEISPLIATSLERGVEVEAWVTEVTGGEAGRETYGCNIRIVRHSRSCRNCEKEVSRITKFCPECGHELGKELPKKTTLTQPNEESPTPPLEEGDKESSSSSTPEAGDQSLKPEPEPKPQGKLDAKGCLLNLAFLIVVFFILKMLGVF